MLDFTHSRGRWTSRSSCARSSTSACGPAEAVFEAQLAQAGTPHAHPPVLEELKAEARERGLWNLFHPHPEFGAGLSNVDYAPLAEIMGQSFIASEACNCNAPTRATWRC
jgi:alkylation response protein AidB-like acyl-CoA dehydrogenase